MNTIHRDIFKAIHEGKWMAIEYRNWQGQITRYWIGILNLDAARRTLKVEGLHLGKYSLETYDRIYIDSILSSQVLDGSYCQVNQELVRDIHDNPHKYKALFDHVANLKVLDYLEDCCKMDGVPYKKDFALVRYLDRESFRGNVYPLSDEQFRKVVQSFQIKAERTAGFGWEKQADKGRQSGNGQQPSQGQPLVEGQQSGSRPQAGKMAEASDKASGIPTAGERSLDSQEKRLAIQRLAINVMSIYTGKGLYVLAYRKLNLDVRQRCLRAAEDITVCTEFTVDGTKESIRRYLDAEDFELLRDFETNQERIKDAVTRYNRRITGVDDMPYVIGLGMDIMLNLRQEYNSILEMYQEDTVTVPIRAFFGDLLDRPRSRRMVPLILLDRKVNLDQLLAINHAMKYPLAYVQGPPGTGKTNTIINTIITAFFNEKTLLFASYNNHPIDGVVEKLTSLTYKGRRIPFPVVRLGNTGKVKRALSAMRMLYEQVKEIPVNEQALEKNRGSQAGQMKRLAELLRRYEDVLELKERSETIGRLLEYSRGRSRSMQMLPFETDLGGRQLQQVNRQMERLGEITDQDALELLTEDPEELKRYLYYASIKCIQRLDEPGSSRLKEILFMEDEECRLDEFSGYIKDSEHLKRLLRVFPVVATTCISASRLGNPEPHFDMTVMDEASQCNTAVGLVPVIRGKSLMLVGDPQQLNPVILLDEVSNYRLRKKYGVPEEYDYRKNSLYKAFLACDSVSDEVLLRYHYRCSKPIIDFNNKKYYNSKLLIRSERKPSQPLVYMDVQDGRTNYKNAAPAEVEAILRYAMENKDKSIGVITPFVNQKHAIEDQLARQGLKNVACGTVHAFQGDEKDVVLFSTAITDDTHAGTYEWLKNNKELINVATSRARDQLIVLGNSRNLERLHGKEGEDDLYDLVRYVRSNGASQVAPKSADSRALGIKPFSAAVEEAFLKTLNHALENIWLSQNRFFVEQGVEVSKVIGEADKGELFYSGKFDFVVYERSGETEGKSPVLAVELDGKEHFEDEVVMERDRRKQEICQAHQIELIRVENCYARRYQHIKGVLEAYFKVRR